MKQVMISMLAACILAGCGVVPGWDGKTATPAATAAPPPDTVRPQSRAVPEGANTAEALDVTTTAERDAARRVPAGGRDLGVTVASLGSPAQAGFWLKTPLVKSEAKGRVVHVQTGAEVKVDLIPLEGEKTAGSRLSLAAFRVLEVPLTDLPELRVYQVQ